MTPDESMSTKSGITRSAKETYSAAAAIMRSPTRSPPMAATLSDLPMASISTRHSLPSAIRHRFACTAQSYAALFYLNYKFAPLDNLSLRGDFFDDMEGQRTGTKTRYLNWALGWQHWLSLQVEFRPEIAYYHSIDANAFNGNFNAAPASEGGAIISPDRNFAWIASMDLIWHF
jgi:hypothetical protein